MINKHIRIKDIAILAGVSIGTVDRVIHNRGEVSETTRERILKILKDEGYTPNVLAKTLASKRKYRIAVILPDYKEDNPYWEKPLLGIQQAESELKNYLFSFHYYFFTDEKSFRQISTQAIESNPDGLLFAPAYHQASVEISAFCRQGSIPFVFLDVTIEECNPLAFFGQDAHMSGYLAARLMSFGLSEQDEIWLIKLFNKFASNRHLEKREAGFNAFFKSDENNKHIHVSSVEIDMTTEVSLFQDMDHLIETGNRAKGIFVISSRVYKVARYLEKKGLRDILLVGYDLLKENCFYLDKGLIQFLICQKPEEQGYKSAMALFNHLISDRKISEKNYSPVDIILKENRTYYN